MFRSRSQSYTNGQLQEILLCSSLLVSFFLSFLKWLLYGDVTGDITDSEVKETSKTIDTLCRIICNNSKRDQSPKSSLAKDGHEDNDSSQQHFH